MRFVVIFLSAGLLSLTSCSEATRESASRPGADKTESVIRSNQHEAANSGSDDQHRVAQNQPENAHYGSSGHGKHGEAQHAHSAHHDASNHQHHSGSHTGHDVSDNSKKILIGAKVPDFEVTINGKLFKFSELQKNAEMTKDGTLVLTFWCSFCHSCRHVEHQLDDLAKKYKNRVGVIALDASAGETTETVTKFAEKSGLTLPIALSTNGTAADVFGVHATTTTVVIDREGVLRYRGQFRDSQHTFAEDALRAVLAGDEISQTETPQQG